MEEFTYYRDDGRPWSVSISKATTAVGGRLVSEEHDLTGVMLWPASHLLCQHLVQGDVLPPRRAKDDDTAFNDREKYTVLELGCGCGLVSLVGAITSSKRVKLWMATDFDDNALDLCQRNFELHGLTGDEGVARIRSLAWGNEQHMETIQHILATYQQDAEPKGFDLIVGADIVYPDTNNETLAALFRTVETLLSSQGTFYLAFATRDGAKTPARLLQAISDAGFTMERLPPLDSNIARKLPPLLDSKLLVLRRCDESSARNVIGFEGCAIFPGLQNAIARLENPSSDEEWEAPFAGSDED